MTYNVAQEIKDVKDDMLFALVSGPWKYIHHLRHPTRSELFNLDNDPGELANLLEDHPEIVDRLKADLLARNCIPPDQFGGPSQMSEEDLQRLRALGYIGE
jgi:arylsulfatase A-like enzyme